MAHLLRSRHDALLVGINTVLVDDPRLTVRLWEGDNPQPVVLDSSLRFPDQAQVIGPSRPASAAVHHRRRVGWRNHPPGGQGGVVRVMPKDTLGRVDLTAALQCLADSGVKRLMVEGGATVINSFLESRLVDYCVITLVPKLIGGIKAMDNRPSDDLPPLSIVDCRYQPLGVDLIIYGSLGKASRQCAPTRSSMSRNAALNAGR